jgi:photosystem II stability/assembly factor-like uncharacterized protein
MRVVLAVLLLGFLSMQTRAVEEFATYRSLDGGQSWSRSDTGLPRASRVNAFGSINNVIFAATDAGMFASLDSGKSWISRFSTSEPTARPLCFASIRGTLFAGTERDGILATQDEGKSWTSLAGTTDLGTVRSLVATDGMLLAGTSRHGIFRSSDEGTSWTQDSQGLPHAAQVHQIAADGTTLFAALYSQGLYRRRSEESNWKRVGTVVPLVVTAVGNSIIVGHNPGGIHWSNDAGETWRSAGSAEALSILDLNESRTVSTTAPVWALASNRNRSFAGAADGIFSSRDQGETWTRAELGLPPISPGVAFLADDRVVLATVIVKQ